MPTIQFKGKNSVVNHHLTAAFHRLEPDAKKSILPPNTQPSLNGNTIIHGDNLLALKALMPTHAGRINCIYIDPPYNTGNEGWCYNDRVNSAMMKEWLGKTVDRDDLTRHDKWCCMMYPRLSLLHELLAEDGVIFISIDDNEQHHLRMLMDEIFGEENFVANIIWQKKFSPQNDAKWFSDNHDFIVCYAKYKETWRPSLLERTEKQNERYKNPDSDPRGEWASSGLDVKTYLAEYDYPITTPSGRVVNPPAGRCWRCSKERFAELVKDNRVWFGDNGQNVPRIKRFLSEVKEGITPLTVWLHAEVGHNQAATQEVKKLGISDFDTPKPVSLFKRIFKIGSNANAIILDSFAGSGTTAHAVLELNKQDGGNRQFILVECEDYADTITAERVRRVINGVPTAKDDNLKNGLGGSFSFWKLGDAVQLQSILEGNNLPSYTELAAYLFQTTTGEHWSPPKNKQHPHFIGETDHYQLYLFYQPDLAYLKNTALTLDLVKQLPQAQHKQRLVFAPTRYINLNELADRRITFCQLPYEIYRTAESQE